MRFLSFYTVRAVIPIINHFIISINYTCPSEFVPKYSVECVKASFSTVSITHLKASRYFSPQETYYFP